MFLRALDTKPLFGHLASFLLTPLGCIKGHLTYFKLSNLNTFCDRAQQFSSCKTITISGQKVKINIMKWVSLSFLSLCCKCNHIREPENLSADTDFWQYQGSAHGSSPNPRAQHSPLPSAGARAHGALHHAPAGSAPRLCQGKREADSLHSP